MLHYALIMLLAGVGIPILAALNAGLGVRLGSPVAASVFLFALAFVLAILAVLLTGQTPALRRVPGVPWHFFLGGLFVAFYVLSVTFIAPKFGVGNAVFFVLIGQLISAAAIDQFGLFSANVTPLTGTRALGIAVMALGVWITQRV